MRLILFLLLLSSTGIHAQTVKVMTYNIRYDNPGDGVNRWDSRKEKVYAVIKKHNPDIIGVQEALHHQLTDIRKNLKGYDFFGVGRDDGKQKGEYSAIFIRKNKFKVDRQGTFWLSETPDVPGSKSWDAAITRVATWAKLTDRKSGKEFAIINTHFDHRGPESREHSARLLKDSAASIAKNLPLIVTGDFNFTRDKAPYTVMMNSSRAPLVDPAPSDAPGTSCGFQVEGKCNGIDYIFHSPGWKSSGFEVVTDHDGKHYPSDHLPVVVTLTNPG